MVVYLLTAKDAKYTKKTIRAGLVIGAQAESPNFFVYFASFAVNAIQ